MTTKQWGILGLVVALIAFIVIAATAKTVTETKSGPTKTETGGVGNSILQAACAALKIKC